jgi:excinuclease ABC subunit A
MDLLPNVTVGCDVCQGKRFKPEVLECLLEGRNIAEMLDASVAELAEHFAQDPLLASSLKALNEIGLGYVRLGQEGGTLSAGERQRLRLAKLLAKPDAEKVAILLDEPTRGLGFEDVDRLLVTLHRLAAKGHLIVAVEHDLDFIASSDWIIDLGPEGGDGGGRVVVQGTPEQVATYTKSYTGKALATVLGSSPYTETIPVRRG